MTERRGGGADFRNDLRRGIDAQPRDFREALHRIVMSREELGHLVIKLAEVILDQTQFFQGQLQQPAIHGIEGRARPEGVGQLSRRRA
jgi:hypothetical protein